MEQWDLKSRIQPALVEQVYARAGIAIAGTVINAAVMTYVLWGLVSHLPLVLWLALTLLAAGGRWVLIRKYRRSAPDVRARGYWERWLTWVLGGSGLLWGASAVFLWPAESIAHQAFIALVIAGMLAGAVGVFSAVMPFFLAFSLPALLPLVIRFALTGDALHLAIAFMGALFAVLTFTTARHINASTKELVVLKETFLDQLEQRTAELQQANDTLRSSEAHIEKSLKEKTVLLQEIHHRVKNNMQVIISLLHLQAAQIKDEKLQSSFKEASSRVNAMALIHNILYESGSITDVHLGDYFQRLTDSLKRMYAANGVQITIRAGGCRLSMDQAIPCGLILNELISNSLKHAFEHSAGHIRIELPACDGVHCTLVVQDDGVGLPGHIDLEKAGTLGLKLVRGLAVHQLGGSIDIERGQKGTRYTIVFQRE